MLVGERVSIGKVGTISFPFYDLGPLPPSFDQPIGDLGFKKIVKKASAIHRKVYHKVVPKSIRKGLKKVGAKFKTYFPKIAPILSIAAQALNFIPGLGVAVGLAITAGAAAINLSNQQKAIKAGQKAQKEEAKETSAEVTKSEAEAHEKANAAFVTGEEYFTKTYGITRTEFEAASLDEKMQFLQTAIEDRQRKETNTTAVILAAGGILVVGALAIIILKKKRQTQGR